MRLGVPRNPGAEHRLAVVTPDAAGRLTDLGYDVVVEPGAGDGARMPAAEYVAAGARVAERTEVWSADVVVTLDPPGPDELALLRPGTVLVSRLAPATDAELLADLAARGVTALALDAVPRISRAQALDVLSALSNVAGYRAVIEAADEFGGMFTGQVTAAGSTPPARVFVIGAGVAGLAAIGTAVSLGAEVYAFDVRPEAAEQIESLGARVVRADAATQDVSADGYASAQSADQEAAALRAYADQSAQADVVITTALVRGTAPTTITHEMVGSMRPGSVVVDLAASGGGNCEATVPGERVVTDRGVVVLGYTDLPARLPQHSSRLLGTVVVNLLTLLTPARDGTPLLDLEDAVVRGMTVARGGQVLWPPPPVQVSAAPPPAPESDAGAVGAGVAPDPALRRRRRTLLAGLGAVAAGALVAISPSDVVGHYTVFALAVVVGFYVISNVTHALHTPLMAQTNAISGIIMVGALLQIGDPSPVVTTLAVLAAALASINVFGGFLVTRRMLGMFRRDPEAS
ncbi:Re/Si-specific NAD(P)(+) transhydrogenase subunit alpha [Isoptericola sp. NEAU-Y5]|uniref:proton-translocating NAD(P)(+) transhydrogenase n=1 Tax=Isoptericola luteus TaxID=2879484 RepID=A0ABS7ZHF7_9MICO|nr:Re/Si-specific NAD(P)(+) transhydrogenase subunit alpha [Isoptericola sp. NEAU-Y5]MCA5893721.1 Re/Si-specific NAD(P)(+) transhydrogenase subunit alpha [Isoptericola sp. NEAU-Y5]